MRIRLPWGTLVTCDILWVRFGDYGCMSRSVNLHDNVDTALRGIGSFGSIEDGEKGPTSPAYRVMCLMSSSMYFSFWLYAPVAASSGKAERSSGQEFESVMCLEPGIRMDYATME